MEYFQVRPVSPNREGALWYQWDTQPKHGYDGVFRNKQGLHHIICVQRVIPNHSRYIYSFVYPVHNVS